MKKLFCLFIILQFSFQGYSQSPFDLLPRQVSSGSFGDTLLNTSNILEREGIKKIMVSQSSSKQNMTHHSWEYIITNGRVSSRRSCLLGHPNKPAGFCHRDSILYDSKGRQQEFWQSTDSGQIYMHCKVGYIGEEKVTKIFKYKMNSHEAVWDSSIYHYYFNDIGKVVRWEQERGPGLSKPFSERLYYNNDGLLDSIRNNDPAVKTQVFKRWKKGKIKIIEWEGTSFLTEKFSYRYSYRWAYNTSGQCLSSQSQTGVHSTTVDYYYNRNGTLSKVVEKLSSGEINTILYSYFK